jgi:hypothetical protein
MSDTNKSQNPNDPHHSEEEDSRKTQIVKKPKLKSRLNPSSDDDESLEFGKHTTVLSSDNPLLRRALSQNASADHNGTTSLGDSREVILLIRGMIERVVMEDNKAYTLGRFDMGIKGDDEIDLTPYGAADRGVSRAHAVLQLDGDHLYLSDLNSTNGTYVAGERLEPNTPTLVHKGDEVLLGRLAIQIMFR